MRRQVGRMALLAARIIAIRDECGMAAAFLSNRRSMGLRELEQCARLSDALGATQDFLKSTVVQLELARRKRAKSAASSGGPMDNFR